jgi:hypothetical protein
MENVSEYDRGREWCPKNTQRELHAVKKLRRRGTWGQGLATTGDMMTRRFIAPPPTPRHVELQRLLSGHLRSPPCRLPTLLPSSFLRRRQHRGHAERLVDASRARHFG